MEGICKQGECRREDNDNTKTMIQEYLAPLLVKYELYDSPMKRYPLGLGRKDQTRRDQELSEVIRQYSHLLMTLEVEP
jgi:hypothetical protein